MAYTLNDYLKQKAAGEAVVSFPSSTPASRVAKKPLAPRLTAPSFTVATLPPAMPAIATWDDVKNAALPVAPALPRLPDPSLPLAPVKSGLANTASRFSASPTFDYVTGTSAPPQPEKPSIWERSSAFANAPIAPSIWDRASKLNQPVAPVQTTAQPQFGSWSDARPTARANPFAPPSFTGAPVQTTPAAPSFGNWGGSTNAFGQTNPATAPGFTAPGFTAPRLSETPGSAFANAGNAFTAMAPPTAGFTPRTGGYTPISNNTPTPGGGGILAQLQAGRPTNGGVGTATPSQPSGAGSNSGGIGILARLQAGRPTMTGNGLSPDSQAIIDDIDWIMRDNNVGDFDRLGIRLNSLSEGIESGLDDNIARARFERVVEDAVAEGQILPLVENAAGVGSLFDPRRSPLNSPQDGLPQYTMATAEEAALYRAAEAAGLGVDGWRANGAEPSSPSQPDGLPSPFPQRLYERLRAAGEARSDILGTLEAGLDSPFTERDLEGMSSLEYYRPPNSNVSWFLEQYGRAPSSQQESWERRVFVDGAGYNEYIQGPYATPADIAFQEGGPVITGNFPDHLYDSPLEQTIEVGIQSVGESVMNAAAMPVDAVTYVINLPTILWNAITGNDEPLPIQNPVGGTDYNNQLWEDITERAGVTYRDPETEMSVPQQHAYRWLAWLLGLPLPSPSRFPFSTPYGPIWDPLQDWPSEDAFAQE